MKQTYLLIIIILLSFTIHSQTTYVPDDNFEQALIDAGHDSGPLDDYVLTANIDGIGYLGLFNKGIIDLTGIEDFASLNGILLAFNNLETLDLSMITGLNNLNCSYNNLTTLKLNNGNNTNLPDSDFRIQNNPNLTCIEVDDADWSTANWTTNVDGQHTFSETCSVPQTYVPDDNFEQALIEFGYDSAPLDDYVPTENIVGVTGLAISADDINDLTGIEDFSSLEHLYCSSNNLNEIDLSGNPLLLVLDLSFNNIITIDLSNNPLLATLEMAANNLTNVDLTQNTSLIHLDLGLGGSSTNHLDSLDLSNNLLLETIDIYGSNLTALDISFCPNLTLLECTNNNILSIDLINNTLLNNLNVYGNNISELNVSNNTVLTDINCGDNDISTLDLSNLLLLEDLDCSHNSIINLDLSNNLSLNKIKCSNNALISLDIKNGNNSMISNFNIVTIFNPDLTCIEVDDAAWSSANWTTFVAPQHTFSEDCSASPNTYIPDDNFEQALINLGYDSGPLDDYVPTANIIGITSLTISNLGIADISGIEDFADLEIFNCLYNEITSADLSQNTSLTDINLSNNSISSINITGSPNMETVQLYDNNLSVLDVSNNPLLTSLNCGINNFSYIDLSYNSELEFLNLNGNSFQSINLSENTELINLLIGSYPGHFNNNLTALDLSNHVFLEQLILDHNNITSLDLSNSPNLNHLDCSWNNIASIDVSQNSILQTLTIQQNLELTELDVTNNLQLANLWCIYTSIITLDLSNNITLQQFYCQDNLLLNELNIKNENNTNMFVVIQDNPSLSCIEVDNSEWSATNWTLVDEQINFNENCGTQPSSVTLNIYNIFLEGSIHFYCEGGCPLMNNPLWEDDLIPIVEPFTALGYTFVNGGNGVIISDETLSTPDPISVVDWLFIELRDVDDPSVIIATQAVLVNRQAVIIDVNEEYITFSNLPSSSFYLTIRHRNHFGIRTLNPITIATNGEQINIDINDNLEFLGGDLAMKTINGVRVMIAGDANGDGQINSVDKNDFWRVENGNPYDYFDTKADFNLDGAVNSVDKNAYWRVNNSMIEQVD